MKKIYSILAAVIITANAFSQAPQKMSYQGVIRNAGNNLVTSTLVGMRISVLQGSPVGASVYVETQTPTTNINGLVSVEVGNGAVVSGTFSAINWANGPYFIKTETDPTGGTSYSIAGTSQLMSVPYALFAGNATTYNAGTGISIAGGTITNTAPNQTVAIMGTGNANVTGAYPNFTVNTTAYTASTGISISGNTITNTAANQTVAITGTGNSNVTGVYPNFTVNTPVYTASTGISITGNTITNASPNQTVNLTGASGTSVTGAYPNYTVTSQRIVRGTTSGGFGPTIINGSGFTVVNSGTGLYTITFTTPFATTPSAVTSIYNLGFTAAQIEVASISTTNMTIRTYNVVTGPGLTAVNTIAFSFTAIGN